MPLKNKGKRRLRKKTEKDDGFPLDASKKRRHPDYDEDVHIGIVRKYHDPALNSIKQAEYERAIRNKNDYEIYSDPTAFLQSVANEINLRAFSIKQQVVEIGGLLCMVKETLPPKDSFMTWVKTNIPQISHSSALNYMRAYRLCAAAPVLVDVLRPSILYRVESGKTFPEKLKTELIEASKDPDFPKNENLHKFVGAVANGKVNLSETELQEEFKQLTMKQQEGEEEQRYREELKGLRNDINKRLQVVLELNKQGRMIPGLNEFENRVPYKYTKIRQMLEGYVRQIEQTLTNLHHDVPAPAEEEVGDWDEDNEDPLVD